MDSIKQQNPQTFVVVETVCILGFTLDYLLRMWSCVERPYQDKKLVSYLTAPMNVVDIVAILPFYLELLLRAGGSLAVIRVLRLARVFRVLKFGTMSENLKLVGEGLSRSMSGLTVFIYLLALFVVSLPYTGDDFLGARERSLSFIFVLIPPRNFHTYAKGPPPRELADCLGSAGSYRHISGYLTSSAFYRCIGRYTLEFIPGC